MSQPSQIRVEDELESLVHPHWIAELDRAPFLIACRNGRVTWPQMQIFLAQHFHYAQHFTRYLCGLLAVIDSDDDRRDLCSNLFEEMGLGGEAGEPHAKLYLKMIQRLGIDPRSTPILPTTAGLRDAMLQSCTYPDPMVGLGAICLGAEAIVPAFYRQIVMGLRSLGISDVEYFSIHIGCDDEHAATMARMIKARLQIQPSSQLTLMKSASHIIRKRRLFLDGVMLASQQPMGEVSHAL